MRDFESGNTFNLDNAYRNATTTIRVIAVGVGLVGLVAPSSRGRLAIHFYSNSPAITLNTVPPTQAGEGLTVNATTPGVIAQRTHGDLATNQWFAWSLAAGFLTIIEVIGCHCETGH